MTVTFRHPEEADACISAVHRRWFDGRTLEAESWDGRTKYAVQESQEEMAKRLNKWHSFIEGDSGKVERDRVGAETVPGPNLTSEGSREGDSAVKVAGDVSNGAEKVPDPNLASDGAVA